MGALESALKQLSGVRKINGGYLARCPCHDDQHASLSVSETPEGKLLLFCHAGCSFEQIIKKLDLPKDGLVPVIVKTYDYTDVDGKLLYQVVRYYPKAFRQRRPDGEGGWVWDLKGITPTLYHLPEVVEAIKNQLPVFIVEGEKDVETLKSQELIATTISGGASSRWSDELVSSLESGDFVIIPDNDEPGLRYAEYVAKRLFPVAKVRKIVLPEGKDITDYLENHSFQEFNDLVTLAQPYIPKGVVQWDDLNGLVSLCRYFLRENKRLSRRTFTQYS